MLAFLKSDADFSRGCARPAMQPPISATHPTFSIRKLIGANLHIAAGRSGGW
jgi:hypothetical protein